MQILELTVNEASKRLKRLSGAAARLRGARRVSRISAAAATRRSRGVLGERGRLLGRRFSRVAGRTRRGSPGGLRAVGLRNPPQRIAPRRGDEADGPHKRQKPRDRTRLDEASSCGGRPGRGRTLLVLDTRSGDPSESLYTLLGYTTAGVIPGYARSASGQLDATTIMYQHLPPAATKLPGSGV